jgi:hypothetical protein
MWAPMSRPPPASKEVTATRERLGIKLAKTGQGLELGHGI